MKNATRMYPSTAINLQFIVLSYLFTMAAFPTLKSIVTRRVVISERIAPFSTVGAYIPPVDHFIISFHAAMLYTLESSNDATTMRTSVHEMPIRPMVIKILEKGI